MTRPTLISGLKRFGLSRLGPVFKGQLLRQTDNIMHIVDPDPSALESILCPPSTDSGTQSPMNLFTSAGDLRSFQHRQISWPSNGTGYCVAADSDPWIVFPASIDARGYRYLVVTMSCEGVRGSCRAQVFWSGPSRPGFEERLSVQFPVICDGRTHTYVFDLHRFDVLGSINHNWWHFDTITSIRFDPLDTPGKFRLERLTFLDPDCVSQAWTRDLLSLPPLRLEMAYRYLNGDGVEIGALQKPLPVPPSSHVRYADRLTRDQARKEYAELGDVELVNPTLICEAHALTPVKDNSVDFVIANHVMEHLRDPLSAIREWLRVLRNGGSLYVAVPEHTNRLDRHRKVTTVEHIVADFEDRNNRANEDRVHFEEWVGSAHRDMPADWKQAAVPQLIERNYAIHFHTFTRQTFSRVLEEAVGRFGGTVMECRVGVDRDMTEFIGIVRK